MSDKRDDLTFGDFLEALHEKGRNEDAERYLLDFFMVSLAYGIDPDDVLSMTIDDLVKAENAPPMGPPGWNTYWGKSVVQHSG